MALKYNNYEYYPCVEFEKLNGNRYIKKVTTQELADWENLGSEFDAPRRAFWSVYGGISDSESFCIAYCCDQDSAILITETLNFMNALYNN